MSWQITGDAEEFLDHAGPFLRSRPVQNTVLITIAEAVRTRGPHVYGPEDPIFGWWGDQGAFVQTPPHPLMLSAMPPDAVVALAGTLAGRPLSGINALTDDADRFAEAWGGRTEVGRVSRLFRLERLEKPKAPAGQARVATETDRDRLIDWFEKFHEDIGENLHPDTARQVDDKISHGGLTLWEVDGAPVAMAGTSRPDSGMVRVLAVYTPREHRARGFGGAVTTAVTQAALDAGATEVVLFTDLANPTSNALYQRLGYRPVEDRKVVRFT